MFFRTEKWSPSQKLIALNMNEMKWKVTEPRRATDSPYLSISVPVIATARKDRATVLYGGSASFWGPRSRFPYSRDELDADKFAETLTGRGNMVVSLDSRGHFLTLTGLTVPTAIRWAQTLQGAQDFLSIAPEGFTGWFQEKK